MFLNAWSIALCLLSLFSLFLLGIAVRTGYRVLRYWNPASDNELQIKLESETWLASTLVAYALGFQIISLVVFMVAADNFCQVIAGAMCATGSLMANGFGLPALAIKIAGIFLYGLWLVIHHLDVSCPTYPLVRLKYWYLLLLMPFLAVDIFLQTAYIAGLKPDIITSCCAVVFSGAQQESSNLVSGMDSHILLSLFYGTALYLLLTGGIWLFKKSGWLALLLGTGWVLYFFISLLAVTTFFSSYVYAMPYHKCPFCLLKPEYFYFGFLLYGTFFPAVFLGLSGILTLFFRQKAGLTLVVENYQGKAGRLSLLLLCLFTILVSWHYLKYIFFGGQSG